MQFLGLKVGQGQVSFSHSPQDMTYYTISKTDGEESDHLVLEDSLV